MSFLTRTFLTGASLLGVFPFGVLPVDALADGMPQGGDNGVQAEVAGVDTASRKNSGVAQASPFPAAAKAQPAGATTENSGAGQASLADDGLVVLPPVVAFAPRVANSTPADSFSMPVTALRFDPVVDVQARSVGETQSDVSIRGGTFENTGFVLEGIPLYAPQTGHYAAELPISPAFLGEPEVRTGASNILTGWNGTAGSIAYSWLPVVQGGSVSAMAGDRDLFGADARAALVSKETVLGRRLAVEIAASHSRGDGPFGNERRIAADGTPAAEDEVPFSDHSFQRYNLRLQQRDARSQTDLFAGYQAKDYAWPNLYAKGLPSRLWRDEREDVRTRLFVLNHRQELGGGDYVRLGASHATTKDHYSIPAIATYHARHTTTVFTATVDGRQTLRASAASATALRYRAGIVADSLRSNTLNAGRHNSRTLFAASLLGEHAHALESTGGSLVLTAGGTLDEGNRDPGALSPAAGISWRNDSPGGLLRRAGIDYSESTQLPTYMALNSAPAGLFGGNASLGRSRARNAQISAEFSRERWAVTPSIFFRRDEDLVDWVFDYATAGSRRARPVDIDTAGLEVSVRRSWEHFSLTLGYVFLHKDDDYTSGVTGSFYAMNYARHRLTAAMVFRLPYGFEIHLDNEFRVQERNRLRTGTDTPLLGSLGIHWRVPAFEGLTLSAQVDNLWNTSFQDVPLVPSAPRTFSARAEYRW
jgi:hypothetical protein